MEIIISFLRCFIKENFVKSMAITILLLVLLPVTASFSHPGGLDDQGGHFNRKTNTYECHKEPCFSIHKQTEEAYQ